tara:strand:+ start:566 stop:787 length:222 start_codon:yes stop_codon:yes gene_type:complete
MVKQKDIWKFNDEEWKVHISDKSLKINVQKKFNLIDSSTIYYENGNLSEETAWDITVPNNLINKVKKYIKDNS